GMAAGLAIMGFGGGALLAAPVKRFLLQFFYTSPEFMGPASQVALITEGGRRFTERAGQMAEVVVVGANDVASMLVPGPQGVYVVGTGSVGAFPTFVTLGLLLFAVMMVAAYSYPAPAPAVPPHIPAQDDAAVGAV